MSTKQTGPSSKISKAKLNRQMRVTIYFGYGLFLLTLVGLGFSTIPWFSDSSIPFFENIDLTLLLAAFAFAALAPPLVGYLAGDGATRNKSKTTHHYNGVLFGILGIWLWMMFSLLATVSQWLYSIDTTFGYAIHSMVPAAIAAIATIILGIFYAKSTKHQVLLIDYTPYRWTLFGSVIGILLGFGLLAFSGEQYGANIFMSILINLVTPLLFMLVAVLVGYWSLGRKVGTTAERIVYALVAIGYGVVSVTLIGQLALPFHEWYGYLVWLALLVWAGYLFLLRRASH